MSSVEQLIVDTMVISWLSTLCILGSKLKISHLGLS